MPISHPFDELNASEVARILKVSPNTVYRLARSGALTSYSVGRKLRFSLSDVEAYISGLKDDQQEPGLIAEKTPHERTSYVLGGTSLLGDICANYLSHSGIEISRSYTNSYDSLVQLYKGSLHGCIVNLWDSATQSYNIPYIKRLVPGVPLIVFHLAQTRQGLIVQRGNPHKLQGWSSLLKEGIVLANREKGSGSRILLDEKLKEREVLPYQIAGYAREYTSALSQASVIARKGADVGIGNEHLFHQLSAETSFIPLQTEDLALVIKKELFTRPLIKQVKLLMKRSYLSQDLSAISGYSLKGIGTELYEI